MRRGFQRGAQGGTALLGDRDSLLAGGAVGVARVHQHGAHAAFVLAQMSAAHFDRRSRHAIARKHRRRACAQGSFGQRNIAAPAGLDAGLGGRPEKSSGKKYRLVRPVQIHLSSFTFPV